MDEIDCDLEQQMLLEQQKIEDEYYLEENQTESFPSNNCDFGTSHDFGNKLISDSCVINTRDHDDLYFAANSIGVDSNSGKYSISSYSNYNATEGNSHQKSSAELALEMRSDRQKLFQSSPAAVKTANKSSITPYLAAESELETTKFHHPILNDQEMVVARQKMHSSPHFNEDVVVLDVPLTKKSFSCILSDGSRVFLHSKAKSEIVVDNASTTSFCLLTKPLHELLRETEELQRIYSRDSSFPEENGTSGSSCEEKQLWVDKFSPKSFTQLLSSERTNREVLRALKRWDPFVFKKGVPAGSNLNSQKHQTSTGLVNGEYFSAKALVSPKKSMVSTKEKYNGDLRPETKVLLLSGPPGTGKTTLAHVVARHCGYRVLEVNASDDRSPEVLRETIARAMQSNNIDNNHRPNCVVLDEIDGVDGKASIDMLVRIINTPMRTKSTLSTEISGTHTNVEEEEENDIGNRPRKKNKADMLLLTRPIICICNDLYAPALRELRKYAEVFHFTAPTDQRLCQRLRHILLTEGVQLSPGILPLLNSLCLSTGLDIRSSINYLQFATQQASYEQNVSKSNDAPKLGVILESILCKTLKDERLDTNGIWRDIFFGGGTTISTASNNKLSTSSEGTAATESMFTRVMNAVTSYNDHNLILAGIYENLPHVRSDTGVNSISWRHGKKDSFMQRESCAISWLSCVDSIMHYSYTNPNSYHLQQYVPLVASATYLYCCAKPSSSSKVIYPKKDRHALYRRQKSENIIRSLVAGATEALLSAVVTGSASGHCLLSGMDSVLKDVISPLVDIVSPCYIRPLPMTSLNPHEKEIITAVVHAMEFSGLSYNLEKDSRPSIAQTSKRWTLHPELQQLVNFDSDSIDVIRRKPLTEEIKHTIFMEQKLFSIQRKVILEMKNMPLAATSSNTSVLAIGQKDCMTPTITSSVCRENFEETIPASKFVDQNAGLQEQLTNTKVRDVCQSVKVEASLRNNSNHTVNLSRNGFKSLFGVAASVEKGRANGNNILKRKADVHTVHFRFNQGYSNAVRRTVTINDFL